MARISLNLVAEQHDLIYHVLAEIRALLKQTDIRDVSNRNRLFTRLHLLCDFLVEHFFIERESFLLPLRRMVRRRKNSERLLRGLKKLEREIDQLRQFAEAFSVRYANPHRKDAGSEQALEDIEIFVTRVDELIRKEDRLLIPLAERVSGRKSRRLNLDQAMVAIAEEAAQRADEENGGKAEGDSDFDEGDGMTDGLVDSEMEGDISEANQAAVRATLGTSEADTMDARQQVDPVSGVAADPDETLNLDDPHAEEADDPEEGDISDELEVEYEDDEDDESIAATVRAVEGAPLVKPLTPAPPPVVKPLRRSLDPDETMAAGDLHGHAVHDGRHVSESDAALEYDTGADDDSLVADSEVDLTADSDADETMDADGGLDDDVSDTADNNGAAPGVGPRRPRRRRRGGGSGRRRISRRRTARR